MQDVVAFDRTALETQREALLAEMVASAARDDAGMLGTRPWAPDRAAAEGFLDAVIGWLEAGPSCAPPVEALLGLPGVLAFASVVESRLPELACRADQLKTLVAALARLGAAVRLRADGRLGRTTELEDVLIAYLNAMHAVSSPMNVVTLGVDMARMRLEAGDMEGLEQALRTIEQGAARVIELRRSVADETPEWAHELRRARASAGGSPDR